MIDSIKINPNVKPVEGSVYFTQRTIYDEKKVDKAYHLKCNFREVDRSISNGYGLQVYNLNYFDYRRSQ